MQTGYKILSVDDDSVVHKIVTRAFEDQYEVVTASNGEEGIKKAIEELPDIIILDVEMPGMNGYEICDRLKHTKETLNIPVVFLSSLNNLRSRMLGYEAGGADFLVKPFDAPEIKAKIANLIKANSAAEVLKEEATVASDAAYVAMKGSSELGMAIHFVESIFTTENIETIAKRFLATVRHLELRCNVMFVMGGKRRYLSETGAACPPLETEVMSTIFDRGQRIVDFGNRTQINYPHIAVLVKNMPLDDMDSYGRYKDLLPVMLGAADSRLKSMELELAISGQTRRLAEAFVNVRSTLSGVGDDLQKTQDSVVALLRKLLGELETEIPDMGLEDDQEKYLIKKLDTAMVGAQDLIEGAEHGKNAFKSVIELLQKLAEKQKELAEQVKPIEPTNQVQEATPDEEDVTGEVELF